MKKILLYTFSVLLILSCSSVSEEDSLIVEDFLIGYWQYNNYQQVPSKWYKNKVVLEIYKENEDYDLAASLFDIMLNNKLKNVNMLGLQETVVNEAAHLYFTQLDKLTLTDFPLKTLKTYVPKNDWRNFGFDYRIIFDWNDPAVEFNVQFVGPKKKYYDWSHTVLDDKDLLEDELNYGYNTEEFVIEKSDKGKWLINIENYTIQDESNPTYIKYTVFKNYGRPNEIKKVKVIDLNKLKQKITLDVLNYYN